jgi:hypothetical protein
MGGMLTKHRGRQVKYVCACSIAVALALCGTPASASEAYMSQIGGPRITLSTPTIEAKASDIALVAPTPQVSVGDISRLFAAYELPTAQASENVASLVQVGNNNSGGTMQIGIGNASLVSQTGDGNFGYAWQSGSSNRSAIYQAGGGMHATVAQRGNGNSAMIIQSR